MAAATERILLGTAVLLLPYYHPVLLAKQLATIDVLSGGRMRLLTVGLGSLPGEAEAVGVDFPARGRRADEAIDVLRLLWTGDENGVSFDGEFFSFANLCSFPKPCGPGTLPIHVGGASRAAARRAGQRGDGYFPGGQLTAGERAGQLDVMRTAAAQAGRDPAAAGIHPVGAGQHFRRRRRGPCGPGGHPAGGRPGLARPGRAAGRDVSAGRPARPGLARLSCHDLFACPLLGQPDGRRAGRGPPPVCAAGYRSR